jgi:hypothetical protein
MTALFIASAFSVLGAVALPPIFALFGRRRST